LIFDVIDIDLHLMFKCLIICIEFFEDFVLI